jgi:hypothetical protein
VLMYLIRKQWVVTSLNLLELLFLVDFVTLTLSTDSVRISSGKTTSLHFVSLRGFFLYFELLGLLSSVHLGRC